MKNKLTFKCLFLFLVCAFQLKAQQKEWIGQVWDEKLNEPLIGVTVRVEGDNVGTITDFDGKFSIKADVNQTLIISYIGYTTLNVRLSADADLSRITMKEDTRLLDEVIVVGYGVQKKVSSVGSIAAAKGEDLLKTGNVTSVSEALQGMMPGVVSIMSDSKPGADEANLIIRGKASWRSSSPLILVDGIERDMNDIDPNEIESLSVLKDASATAVYGVKGANGVVLVTTKRGVKQKPKISFSANFGFKQPLSQPEYADYVTSMRMWNEAARNDLQYAKLIPQSTISAWENAFATGNVGPYNTYFPNIDWWNEMVSEVGYQQQYNINISGGTEFMRYFSSVGYLNDGDIFRTQRNDLYDPTFRYQRYNWRSNFDFQLTRSTLLSLNLSGRKGYRSQTGYRLNDNNEDDNSYGQPQFFKSLYIAPRNLFPITWEDGTYGVTSSASLGDNPRLLFDRGQRIYKYYQNFIDTNLDQDLSFITEGLRINGKFSYNVSTRTRDDLMRYGTTNPNVDSGPFGEKLYIGFYRKFDYSQPLENGGYAMVDERRWVDNEFQGERPKANYDNMLDGGFEKRLYYEFALNYDRTFGNHYVAMLALVNRNEIEGLAGGSASSLKFKENQEDWVTRVVYNWKEKYLLEFNGAYSGSQKFARGKRFQFFPSYSLGWRISEEPFVKKITGKMFDNIKIRYSSGKVGYHQSATAYTYQQLYDNVGGNVGFGENERTNYGPLYVEGKAANPNATWETGYKQNLGLDLMMFNKLTATLDMYTEKREGIIMTVATPAWFGIREPDGNIGETKSRGLEAEIGWNDRINKDWSYWVKANYAINENRIVYRNDAANLPQYLKLAGKPIGVINKLQVNGYYESLDDIYNYVTATNVSTQSNLVPGDFMYLDYDANGVIDQTWDKIPMQYNNYPQNTYGGMLGFRYKSFQVNAMFYGVINVYKDVDGLFLWDLSEGNAQNYFANPDVIHRWTRENPAHAKKPALHSDYRGYSMSGGTTYSFQNASYFRLKNLELSYDLKNSSLTEIGINTVQLYVNANNVFTITKFNSQVDPEANSSGLYPLVRRYNIGTRITF